MLETSCPLRILWGILTGMSSSRRPRWYVTNYALCIPTLQNYAFFLCFGVEPVWDLVTLLLSFWA